jgi:hypothetical protein
MLSLLFFLRRRPSLGDVARAPQKLNSSLFQHHLPDLKTLTSPHQHHGEPPHHYDDHDSQLCQWHDPVDCLWPDRLGLDGRGDSGFSGAG